MTELAKAAEVGMKAAERGSAFDPDKKVGKGEFSFPAEARQGRAYDPDRKVEKGEAIQNKDVPQEAERTERKGGSYGDLKKEGHGWNHEPPEEVHHMPADESSPLDRNDGPAIAMDYEDHRQTASCGNSREAQEYRAKQKELIAEGKFAEAMQMDIDDIRDKFGSKYDDAIAEMKEYAKSKGYI